MQKDDADARMGAPTLEIYFFGKAPDEFVPNRKQELGRKIIIFYRTKELTGLWLQLTCFGTISSVA